MSKDTQCRKWQITLNNPADKGYTHDVLKERLAEISSIEYWCMCDEVGENGTYHTHLYFYRPSGVRFSTVKNLFPEAHIEMAKGTHQQNRDYIRKEGKWAKDKKKETNLIETFEEMGEMPLERQGSRNDIADLYNMIKSGMSDFEIIEDSPQYLMNIDKIERARQIIRDNQFRNTWRNLEVTYVYGTTGTGKSRGVMEEYGYDKVFRVINYERNPWDNYEGQDVVMFEEFRGQFKCHEMLNFLDGYPLMLACRYTNKVACYTKVFICTNVPLEDQYKTVQLEHKETWNAFIRRIHKVKVYSQDGVLEYTLDDYMNRNKFTEYDCPQEEIPF